MQSNAQRKKLWWAVAASLFLHLFVAFLLVGFNTAFAPPVVLEDDDKPVELTMVDLSATPPPMTPIDSSSTPAPKPTPKRASLTDAKAGYVNTDDAKEVAEPSKDAVFESSANSKAASERDPEGDLPLPTQEGKDLPDVLDFETRQATLGEEGVAAQPPPQTPAPAATATPPPPQTPRPRPSVAPQITPLPEPTVTPSGEQLAMLTGTPPPPIRDPQETETTSPPPETAATPAPAVPRPLPERPNVAYRSGKEQTKISGRITNRGAAAVDAVGTPFGRYSKSIEDAIGSRWHYYVKAKSDLVSIGTTRIAAEVDPQGRVRNLRVVSNTANETFANICLQSFQEAEIPAIPPDLVAALPGGQMPVEFTFICY